MIRPTHRNRRHPPEPGVILNPEPRAVPLNRRHPEPGFSRVKDLARSGTGLVGTIERAGVPADPREILHGLKAVQDDAVTKLAARVVRLIHRTSFTGPNPASS